MTPTELSNCYLIAVKRLQESLINLYEELHDEQGSPLPSLGKAEILFGEFRKDAKIEFDLIRESIIEFNETDGNSSTHRRP
jgi:hypothetical protein